MSNKKQKKQYEEIIEALKESEPLGNLVSGFIAIVIGTIALQEATRSLKEGGMI